MCVPIVPIPCRNGNEFDKAAIVILTGMGTGHSPRHASGAGRLIVSPAIDGELN